MGCPFGGALFLAQMENSVTPEQQKVIELLNRYAVDEIRNDDLKLMCDTVMSVRTLNRKLLDRLNARSWKPFTENKPSIGDDVLIRYEDPTGLHIEFMEWTEEDEEFFEDEGGTVHWMRVPRLDR